MKRSFGSTYGRHRPGRTAGGWAALPFPLLLMFVGLSAGFRRGGDMGDLAASFLGALLFLLAAPTAWLFAIEFIEASRFTILAVGAVTSLPFWYLLGRRIADGVQTWSAWAAVYAGVVIVWVALNFVVVVTVARLVG